MIQQPGGSHPAGPARFRLPPGRLHPALRVALYLPAIGLTSLALGLLASMIWWAPLAALPLLADWGPEQVVVIAGQSVVIVSVVLVTWLFRRTLDRQSFASLGFQRDQGWLAEVVGGFGLGLLLMGLILGVELVLGAYRLVGLGWRGHNTSGLLIGLASALVAFAVVAFYEELLARGYVLQNLATAWGRPAGALISSALFALAHLANPGAGLLSLLGLFVAGLLLASGYLATGRLWLPIGLHLSWNFVQGPVLGFPVSGIETVSLLRLEPVGPDLLTGGSFGPEASLIGIVAELLGILLLTRWRRRAS